ncbi:MAG: arginase [Sedimenticola thiotaurini]|uniref:Arginase n=1 Tax=Sedimenticola thiotaurini TaxID=1543721 RepID=A0A558DEV4_9GAMM|nr:MAG: arginase [Sedimenticola thiotaurini]
MRRIATLGVASGQASRNSGCWRGPMVLKDSIELQRFCHQRGVRLIWQDLFEPNERASKVDAVAGLCREVARFTTALVKQQQPFLCFGGDHSCAMGVWSGVMRALPEGSKLGLIWIDAHMDAHTFKTTPSGNIHGMPVAALLGQGDRILQRIYGGTGHLEPHAIVLVGVRSYEPAEQALLNRLGVRVIKMSALTEPDALCLALKESVSYLAQQADYLGISIDLDAVDPGCAPAVGVPEPGGIDGRELSRAVAGIADAPGLVGMEIAEFCPRYDSEKKTIRLIGELVTALYGDMARREVC